MRPMNRIEKQLENTIRELNLPPEERMKKQSTDVEKIRRFRIAHKACQKKLDVKLDKHVFGIYQHLKGLGRQIALSNWKSDDYCSDKSSVVDVWKTGKLGPSFKEQFDQRVLAATCQYEGFADMVRWADSREVANELENIVDRYTSLVIELNREIDLNQEVDPSERLATKIGRMLALGIPTTVLGLAVAPLTIVVGSFLLLQTFYSTHKLQSSLEAEYDKFVNELKEDDYSKLKTFVTDCAAVLSHSMYYVYKTIPKRIEDLERDLKTRVETEEEVNPTYITVYKACQPVKESLSEYMVNSGIHEFHEKDLLWPHGSPIACGSGGSSIVCQAQIVRPDGIGLTTDVAVKVLYPCIDGLFSAFLKEREDCRYCINHPVIISAFMNFLFRKFNNPNLVKFYGSTEFADFQRKGKHLALIFEWCENRSLSSEIFDGKYPKPSSHPDTCQRANEIMLQLTDGLTYLHRNKVVHRDIKPENILVRPL